MVKSELDPNTIKQLIAGEAKNRGAVMGVLIKAFIDKYGSEAVDVANKALFKLGELQGNFLAHNITEKGIIGFRKASASAPNEINPFDPEEVELSEEKAIIRLHSCPLYDAWNDLGYSDELMKKLCDIAMERDFGQLKGLNGDLKLDITKQLAYGDQYCELVFRKKD